MQSCLPTPGIAVSVIVAAFNPGHLLKLALDSVYSQTYKASEVIVVDDGSTKDLSSICIEFPGIKLIKQRNRGIAAARNAGIMNSTGDLIAFLDADDVWYPNKLAHQAMLMVSNPEVGLCFAEHGFIDGSGQRTSPWGLPYPQTQLSQDPQQIDDSVLTKDDWTLLSFEDTCVDKAELNSFADLHFNPSSVMVRRSCLIDVGLFDTLLRRSQDTDLWIRIALKHKLAGIKKELAQWRVHSGSLTHDVAVTIRETHFLFDRWELLGRHRGRRDIIELAQRLRERTRYHYGVRAFELARSAFKLRRSRQCLKQLVLAFRLNPRFVSSSLFYWCKVRMPLKVDSCRIASSKDQTI